MGKPLHRNFIAQKKKMPDILARERNLSRGGGSGSNYPSSLTCQQVAATCSSLGDQESRQRKMNAQREIDCHGNNDYGAPSKGNYAPRQCHCHYLLAMGAES